MFKRVVINKTIIFNLWVCLFFSLTLLLAACQNETQSSPVSSNPAATISSNSDWPQLGHDAGATAANNGFKAVNPANVTNLSAVWTYQASTALITAPAVVGDTLYLNNQQGAVVALDRSNGNLRWTFNYNGRSSSTPAVAQNKVFFSTANGLLYALNSSNGKQIWQQDLARPVAASPTYDSGRLYLATRADPTKNLTGALLALNPDNGSIAWQYNLPGPTLSDSAGLQAFLRTPPVVNHTFYLPDRVSQLSSGVVRFDTNQKSFPDAPATTSLTDTGLVGPTDAGPVLFGTLPHSSGAVAIATDKALTAPYWYFGGPDDSESNQTPHPGAFANNTFVYAADDFNGNTHLYAIGADGKPRWDNTLEGRSLSAPTIAAGIVYSGTEAGQVLAFDLNNGQKLWQYNLGASIRSQVVPAGDMLYVAATNGSLYAFSTRPANATTGYALGQNNTVAVYAAPDQKGNSQIFGLKDGKPVQLTTGDFALPTPGYPVDPAKLNSGPAVSPDGRKIAFVSFSKGATKSTLYLMNIDGSDLQPLADSNSEPTNLAWTADGLTLMFVSIKDGQLYFYNFGTNFPGLHAITTNYFEVANFPQTSPDNRYILWKESDRISQPGVGYERIVRLDRDGQHLLDLVSGLTKLSGLAVSHAGNIAYATLDRATNKSWVWLTDMQGSFKRRLVEGAGPLNFAPDGRLLYTPAPDCKLGQASFWLNCWGRAATPNGTYALTLDVDNNVAPHTSPVKLASQTLSWVKPDTKLNVAAAPAYQPYYFPANALQNLPYGKYVFSASGSIYESDAKGVRLAQLTSGGANHDSNPQLSHDGSKIVFVRQQTGSKPQVWVMDALGQNQHPVTSQGANTEPAWSGDDTLLAFTSDRDGHSNIWLMNPNVGENSVKQLTNLGNNYSSSWSPDDKSIVFTSDRSSKEVTLAGVKVKPTDLYQIATTPDAQPKLLTKFQVSDGWLGVSNVSFQASARYFTFTALRYTRDQAGKYQAQAIVGVHDTTTSKDYFENVNCAGSSPIWANDKDLLIACVQVQPNKLMSAEEFSQGEPGGTFVRGIFDAKNKVNGGAVVLLDPRRYLVSGLSWSAK